MESFTTNAAPYCPLFELPQLPRRTCRSQRLEQLLPRRALVEPVLRVELELNASGSTREELQSHRESAPASEVVTMSTSMPRRRQQPTQQQLARASGAHGRRRSRSRGCALCSCRQSTRREWPRCSSRVKRQRVACETFVNAWIRPTQRPAEAPQ